MAATYLDLFAGVSGLGLGFEAGIEYITGRPAVCVGYVEREAYAASTILARMADQALEPAPVWCGDICGGVDVSPAPAGPGVFGCDGFELPLFPPGPGDRERWAAIIAHEAGFGLAPAIEPGICLLADGMALVVDESRPDQLRCAGNGVVPLQAAAAFVQLVRQAGIGPQ